MEIDELKKRLATARADGVRNYPTEVRREAVGYAKTRQTHGATLSAIAAELGVDASTLSWWLRVGTRKKSAPRLARVEVVPSAARTQASVVSLVLEFGQNIRVTGLDVASTAALLRLLS